MESNGEAQGDEMVKKAESTLKTGKLKSMKGPSKQTFMLFDIPTNSEKVTKAIDLYTKAGNSYKLAKSYTKAGNAYNCAAQLEVEGKRGNYHAALNYIKAAEMFQKVKDNAAARKSFEIAVKLLSDDGKFVKAAKVQKQLAEIAMEEGRLLDAALAYESAHDFFMGDSTMVTTAHNCLSQAGYIATEADEFEWAIRIFEKIVEYHSTNTKNPSASSIKCKNFIVEASICRLYLGDIVETKKSITRYCRMCDDFVRSKEYKLFDTAIRLYESFDAEQFGKVFTEFAASSMIKSKKTLIEAIQNRLVKDLEDDLT